MRIKASSESNKNSDNVFANSVLPTPVGPKKIKDPIGRLGSLKPARVLCIVLVNFSTALSCPTTRCFNVSAICSNRWLSSSAIRLTGIPVIMDITEAISSSVTEYLSSFERVSQSALAFSRLANNFFSLSLSLAASSKF